jgi:hypothetical protein
MISGLNTDVEYEGKIYHVQTEDGGSQSPMVVTHLFQSGAIVSSRKTSYVDVVTSDKLVEVVRGMMKEQHRSMIQELLSGRYRQGQTAMPQAGVDRKPQSSVAKRKSLDDLILDYLSSKESEDRGKGG